VDTVERIAKKRGVTMAEIALAWLLGRPGVTAPIVGATKPEHLEAALRAVSLELTVDEQAALEAPYRPHGVRGID
jgi:1-deoxyxylulose-5-phosphate synthase